MAFKKGSNITCRIGKVNDAFDEKGNVAKEILKSIKLFINNKPEHLKKEFFDLN